MFGCNVVPAFAKTKHWNRGWKRKKMLYHFSAQVCAMENYEENKSSKNYGYPRNRQSEKHWKRGITQSLGPLEMYHRALNRKHFGKGRLFFSPFLLREIALSITIVVFFFWVPGSICFWNGLMFIKLQIMFYTVALPQVNGPKKRFYKFLMIIVQAQRTQKKQSGDAIKKVIVWLQANLSN